MGQGLVKMLLYARFRPGQAERPRGADKKLPMRKDQLIILVTFLVAVTAAMVFQLVGNGEETPPPTPPLRPSAVGEFRGLSLQLHSGHPGHPYVQYVDEIAATGANTISLVVAAYQENCSSTSIFVDARKTPSDDRLRELIDRAHRHGLRVVLMPIVLLENPRGDEWRGKISPPKWDDWWEDYENYIRRYAVLAAEGRVEVLMIGSELVSTEDQADRWRRLIQLVRGIYKGRLGYSANWDHYRPITWWGSWT